MKSRMFTAAIIVAGLFCVGAVSRTTASDQNGKDIVDTAVGAGSFKTLVTAVKAADLVGTLKGEGPFTVFAPSDEAFAKIPKEKLEALLKDKKALAAVLTYHVVSGKVMAADVVKLTSAKTVQGQPVSIVVKGGKVMINNANVVKTDIACKNGVIHVIDTVIMPPAETKDIVDTAVGAGSFKTLVTAVKTADLVDTLKGEGPFTVFAPTDEAFAKIPNETLEALLKDKKALAGVLTYHVVPGKVMAADVVKLQSAKTAQGNTIDIVVKNGKVMINGVNVVKTDIACSNGVIHVIDGVLMPSEANKIGAAAARTMIERAIAHGVKTFNSGDHAACSDIYMATMREIVANGDNTPEHIVSNMKLNLEKAAATSCPTERSWVLRRGLDHAYARMTGIH